MKQLRSISVVKHKRIVKDYERRIAELNRVEKERNELYGQLETTKHALNDMRTERNELYYELEARKSMHEVLIDTLTPEQARDALRELLSRVRVVQVEVKGG